MEEKCKHVFATGISTFTNQKNFFQLFLTFVTYNELTTEFVILWVPLVDYF